MKARSLSSEKERRSRIKLIFLLLRLMMIAAICGIFCESLMFAAQEQSGKHVSAGNQQNGGSGLYFNAEATAKDVGLPIYPGARPHSDKDDDKPSAKFGLWGNSFAFKLAVVKLESNDSPEKVAAFYKKALAKYGTVLDCANASSSAGDNQKSGLKQLSCEDDKPARGDMTFKAGTKQKQHVVGIQPNGRGSIINLVYVESPDQDKEN